ncbi:MAG: hypothetical protein GY708_20640 [Actinomycetia bacterium]|nr:hypothetical protein [Actinomycetes bacterium]
MTAADHVSRWAPSAVVATAGWLAASAGLVGSVENEALAGVLIAGLAGMVGAIWKIAASHSAMDQAIEAMGAVVDALREELEAERASASAAAEHDAERIDLLESKLVAMMFGDDCS